MFGVHMFGKEETMALITSKTLAGPCVLCGRATGEAVIGKRGTVNLHGDCWERASFD